MSMKHALTEVIIMNSKQFENLKKLYEIHEHPSSNPYVIFFAKDHHLTVAVYKHDTDYKVVFQGSRAAEEALLFRPRLKPEQDHMGSDEVGTGDFFGPIVVAATFVSETMAHHLRALGVKDSKLLDDSLIRKLGKKLIKQVPYAINILNNQTFNQWTAKPMNMNEVKAVLHHQVLTQLSLKIQHHVPIIIDQFCDEKHYQRYLAQHQLSPLPNIQFIQKAESKYLAVAAASIVARYRFLLAIDKLEEHLKTPIPLGASNRVESFALAYAQKHGLTKLSSLVKTNFSTFDRIKKALG